MKKDNAKQSILEAIEAAKVPEQALPSLSGNLITYASDLEKFKESALFIGSRVVECRKDEIMASIKEEILPSILKLSGDYDAGKSVLRTVTTLFEFSGLGEDLSEEKALDPHQLQDVDVAILKAEFGVAENGALWFDESQFVHRVLPYICQHLIVLLDKKSIVTHMHEAYERVGSVDYGFSGFIAGPSKTADIEQSLVIGAHGPRSHTVILVE